MAYNSSDRFQCVSRRHIIFDPGAYQCPYPPLIKPNKAPFLSNKPRCSTDIGKIWTHEIYYRNTLPKVSNCTAFKSKVPRFQYESHDFNYGDVTCDCEGKESDIKVYRETKDQVICQAKINRRIFKGLPDYTFEKKITLPRDIPFYDSRVQESTAFYRGCKWSKWTSKRNMKIEPYGPGPAEYNIVPEPNELELCDEKFRDRKRNTSRQLRYLDVVQRRNILDNLPGPASYSPILPQRKDFQYIPTRNKNRNLKLIKVYNLGPGPADHFIRRDFDIGYDDHNITCHLKLSPRAPFGVKAIRFKPRKEEGPSPASYSISFQNCHMKQNLDKPCIRAPFGTSAKRFHSTPNEISDDEDLDLERLSEVQDKDTDKCKSSWPFKSKTVRMKSPKACELELSPTMQTDQFKIGRSTRMQYLAPFYSSEGRLRNWFNWINMHGAESTPGPAYYCLERPKCIPAVCSGPLVRGARFKTYKLLNPAPNQFVLTGIENILRTHNLKLKTNIDKSQKSQWQRPSLPVKLTPEEQEKNLLDESIALLDGDDVFEENFVKHKRKTSLKKKRAKISYVGAYEKTKKR